MNRGALWIGTQRVRTQRVRNKRIRNKRRLYARFSRPLHQAKPFPLDLVALPEHCSLQNRRQLTSRYLMPPQVLKLTQSMMGFGIDHDVQAVPFRRTRCHDRLARRWA